MIAIEDLCISFKCRFYFQEIISPLYFVAILAIIRATTKIDPVAAVSQYPTYNIQDLRASFSIDGKTVSVSPDTNNVRTIINNTVEVLQGLTGSTSYPSIQYYADTSAMGSVSSGLGIVFQFDGSSTMNYALRMPYDSMPDTTDTFKGLGM